MQIESDLMPVTPKVAGFAAVMDATLRMGGLQDKWAGLSYQQRLSYLVHECEKLKRLPQEQAFVSATVVGLFAMMVADGAAASVANRPDATEACVGMAAEEPLE